jgi:peptide deformylase
VTRPARVRVSYTDRDGKRCRIEADGLLARCLQHEIDHLDGKLFIEYLGIMKRQLITRKMQKLKRERARA